MNLSAIRRRIEALEEAMTAVKEGGSDISLTPYDVCVLMIERFDMDDSPENEDRARMIDALLEIHRRSVARSLLTPMRPAEAAQAFIEAYEREKDDKASNRHKKERIDKLIGDFKAKNERGINGGN